jgi:carbon-monoxide dehydrogenase large subunit
MSAKLQPIGDTVGQSLPRIEAQEKITGQAVYTDDMILPGMLHAAVLGSDYAHARIVSCDTSAAKALPGVKAVLCGEDLPNNFYGMCIQDEPILARGKVRYVSEPVAAVAAVDLATAKQALQLIEVEYQELDAVFDVEELRRAGGAG